MLSYDDPRWTSLDGAFGTPSDLRPLLRQLETTSDSQPVWDALWEEMYHQGDVGPNSYVAIPHLVRIHRIRAAIDWNTYALVASVEISRGVRGNPDAPEWARAEYEAAIRELAEIGLSELPRATAPEVVRSILAVLAIAYGAKTYGRLIITFGEEEIAELIHESDG